MASFSFSNYCSFLVTLFMLGRVSANLSNEYFYSVSCPKALGIIQREVQKAVKMSLAWVPHCFASISTIALSMQGCDASVLLDDASNFKGEKNVFPNKGSLRGFEVIDKIKQELEKECPRTVSCADILAVAARDSVDALRPQPYGKLLRTDLFPFPTWKVELGRRDSKTASTNNANTDLPTPLTNLTGLISAFSKKGFTTQEMVILLGGHTVGQIRCVSFRDRIYNETNINPIFAFALRQSCPRKVGDGNDNLAPSDGTFKTFDNTYFRDLVREKGVLHSDQELFNDGPTDDQVRRYSNSPARVFLEDFGKAMIKMGRLNPLTGSAG